MGLISKADMVALWGLYAGQNPPSSKLFYARDNYVNWLQHLQFVGQCKQKIDAMHLVLESFIGQRLSCSY